MRVGASCSPQRGIQFVDVLLNDPADAGFHRRQPHPETGRSKLLRQTGSAKHGGGGISDSCTNSCDQPMADIRQNVPNNGRKTERRILAEHGRGSPQTMAECHRIGTSHFAELASASLGSIGQVRGECGGFDENEDSFVCAGYPDFSATGYFSRCICFALWSRSKGSMMVSVAVSGGAVQLNPVQKRTGLPSLRRRTWTCPRCIVRCSENRRGPVGPRFWPRELARVESTAHPSVASRLQ